MMFLGFGSSAIVHHAIYLPFKSEVAVKMIDLDHFERNQIDELRREIQVMNLCKHPNLLRTLASFVHESKLWIVTPYLAGGSCLDIIKGGYRDGLEETVIATILQHALQGLDYLHRNGHIHRDVKAANLLMDKDGTVQLADFGVSSCLTDDADRKGVRKTFVGTPCWMAPEVMELTKGYDFKADIWSFGITALELAYGHAPFSKYPPMKVIYLTLSNDPPRLERKRCKYKYSKNFKELVDLCLQKDPSKRPSAETLLKHSFFKAAKKKGFLVTEILQKIPPLEERLRLKRLAKEVMANTTRESNEQQANDTGDDGDASLKWDFSSNEESIGVAMDSMEQSISRTNTFSTSEDDGNKASRFVVEADPVNSDSAAIGMETNGDSVNSIEKSNSSAKLTSPTLSMTETSGEADESGIRKGRFSVLESAEGEDAAVPTTASAEAAANNQNPSDSLIRSFVPTPPPPEDSEEGRRSRFKVETALDAASYAAATTIAASSVQGHLNSINLTPLRIALDKSLERGSPVVNPSRFEVRSNPHIVASNVPQGNGNPAKQTNLSDGTSSLLQQTQHFPNQNHNQHQQSALPSTQQQHHPSAHPSVCNASGYFDDVDDPIYYAREYGRPASHGSFIFIHPSQLDQLLLLNELIRQQLLELRNSTGHCNTTRNPSPPRPYDAFQEPYPQYNRGYWDNLDRDPMMEDPRVAYPVNFSTYSSYTPSANSNNTRMESVDLGKRRSFSIDARHPAHLNTIHGGGGVPFHHEQVQKSTTHHRSVHSVKNHFHPPSETEILRREVEYLRRENQQLLQRTST